MATPPPPLYTRPWVHLLSVLLSLALHLGVAAPYVAWQQLAFDREVAGDGGVSDGAVGDGGAELVEPLGPVNVSVYQEPRATPPPRPAPRQTGGAASGGGEGEAPAEAPTADETRGSNAEPQQPTVLREGSAGKPPRGRRTPCDPVEEIVPMGDRRWRVERDMLDWYASHLKELGKEVGVAPHKGPDGKRDGARLWVPRCSVLRQAGIRHGDVIHRINGRKVNNIAQGVTTWFAVRNDRVVEVELTRRDGEERVHTYRLK